MLPQAELNKTFTYDNGILRWAVKRTNNVYIGKPITATNKYGYTVVGIGRKIYQVSRIIFCMHYGYMPEIIDHINGDTQDNRIENLREANKSLNAMNSKRPVTNTSGVKGVSYCRNSGKWVSSVQLNKKQYKTKFNTKEEAIAANIELRNKLHKEFSNLG